MKANKAIGLDKISDRLLGEAAGIIAPPSTYIINSVFLEAWEISFSLEVCEGHCPLQTRRHNEKRWITIDQYSYLSL